MRFSEQQQSVHKLENTLLRSINIYGYPLVMTIGSPKSENLNRIGFELLFSRDIHNEVVLGGGKRKADGR